MATVILGLGSNIGDREQYLARAVAHIRGWPIYSKVGLFKCSSVYETSALLPDNAPPDWDIPYYNMAIVGESEIPPMALLDACQQTEKALERKKRGYWGPREIDVDVLGYGDLEFCGEALVVPHPRLLERRFALEPAAEIAGDWLYPATGPYKGMKLSEIAALILPAMPAIRRLDIRF